MFLHFHGKYNMILFVLQILDYIQIKTLNSFCLFFYFYNSITYIKIHTHLFFLLLFFPTFTCYKSHKFKINQTNITQFKYYRITLKNPVNYWEGFWTTKIVAARLLHAPLPLAARGFTRCRKNLETVGSGSTSPAKEGKHRQSSLFGYFFRSI